mmetsp:Transcript_16727/g.38319  ORF Transcript_16727/g.38319 Transcript_16727/m.38319 type:complete len:212 (-) Transcript_16727:596-1231(-)
MPHIPAQLLVLYPVPFLVVYFLYQIQNTVCIVQVAHTDDCVSYLDTTLQVRVEESMQVGPDAFELAPLTPLVGRVLPREVEVVPRDLQPPRRRPPVPRRRDVRLGEEWRKLQYALRGHDAVGAGDPQALPDLVQVGDRPVRHHRHAVPDALDDPPYEPPVGRAYLVHLVQPRPAVDREHGGSRVDEPLVKVERLVVSRHLEVGGRPRREDA